MFDRRIFVKNGLLDAVGKMPDYWVTLNADSYGEKGVLTEEDLDEVQGAIDEKNKAIADAEEAYSAVDSVSEAETEEGV